MSTFNKLLNEALENTSYVSLDEFLNFATAIVASTSTANIPKAIERAMALSQNELANIIKQVQFTGDTRALLEAMSSKPEYTTQFVELGRKVLPEKELQKIIEIAEAAEAATKAASAPPEGLTIPIPHRFVRDPTGMLITVDQQATSMEKMTDETPCPSCDKLGMTFDLSKSYVWHNININCPSCGFNAYHCDNCGRWSDEVFKTYTDENGMRIPLTLWCADCAPPKETYNAEGDYYNQGTI